MWRMWLRCLSVVGDAQWAVSVRTALAFWGYCRNKMLWVIWRRCIQLWTTSILITCSSHRSLQPLPVFHATLIAEKMQVLRVRHNYVYLACTANYAWMQCDESAHACNFAIEWVIRTRSKHHKCAPVPDRWLAGGGLVRVVSSTTVGIGVAAEQCAMQHM